MGRQSHARSTRFSTRASCDLTATVACAPSTRAAGRKASSDSETPRAGPPFARVQRAATRSRSSYPSPVPTGSVAARRLVGGPVGAVAREHQRVVDALNRGVNRGDKSANVLDVCSNAAAASGLPSLPSASLAPSRSAAPRRARAAPRCPPGAGLVAVAHCRLLSARANGRPSAYSLDQLRAQPASTSMAKISLVAAARPWAT